MVETCTTKDIENSLYDVLINDVEIKDTLQDTSKLIPYTNYGARFLTTPQLIDDTTNLDLYGNELLGKRVYKE